MDIKEQLDIQAIYARQAAEQIGNPAPLQPEQDPEQQSEPAVPSNKPARGKKAE